MSDKINVRIGNQQSLAEMLSQIDQQTLYNFSFLKEDFETIKVKPVDLKAERLENVLKLLQKEYGLEYAVNNNSILFRIAKGNQPKTQSKGYLYGQLIDEVSNESLIGAIIRVDNQTVQTDVDGKFFMALSPGIYTANVSNMGYSDMAVQQINIKSSDTTKAILN
jgi:hypothetical protein